MSLTQRETDIWRVEAMIDIKKTVADVVESYMGNRGKNNGNDIERNGNIVARGGNEIQNSEVQNQGEILV